MKNNIYFVKAKNGDFGFYVNGECITDCYNVDDEGQLAMLIYDLVKFADVPIYEEISIEDRKKTETAEEFLRRI